MDDKQVGWKKFRSISLDKKQLLRRAKKIEGATQRHAHRFVVRRLENVKMVSREITIWLTLVGLIIAGLGVQMYFAQLGYTTTARADGGVYSEGVVGTVDTLNPLFATSESEASVGRLVFSSLYAHDTKGALRRDLATSMTMDPAGKIYTITMRSGAQWHDGKPVTAKDVIFTLNLIKNPATRAQAALRSTWLDVAAAAKDDKTIVFTLPVSYAAFPHALTFAVLPEHLLAKVAPGSLRESPFSVSPVGSGPFSFRLLQAADKVSGHKVVHLNANKNYYGGTPKLNRFEIHAFQDSSAMVKSLKAGELSGASDVPPLSLKAFDSSAFARVGAAHNNGVYLLLNQNNPILKESAVRKALQVGTDAAAVRQGIGGDQLVLDLPVLASQVSGEDVPHAPLYDLTKARGMLDEAGWKIDGEYRKKDGKVMELTITTIKDPEYEKATGVIRDQYQQLGIKVNVSVIDTSVAASTFVQDTLQARNFDLLLHELVIGADPDVYAYWHSSQVSKTGYNFSGYANKTADLNLISARSRVEPELRNIKYKQFAKQWLEDVPAIGLYQPAMEYVTVSTASAVRQNAELVTSADRYANVLDWTVNEGTVYKTP